MNMEHKPKSNTQTLEFHQAIMKSAHSVCPLMLRRKVSIPAANACSSEIAKRADHLSNTA